MLVLALDLGAFAVELLLNATADDDKAVGHRVAKITQRAEHAGPVKHRTRAGKHFMHVCMLILADASLLDDRLCFLPMGVAARRQSLADTGRAKAQADVAVLTHGLGELEKAPVLFGENEGPAPQS